MLDQAVSRREFLKRVGGLGTAVVLVGAGAAGLGACQSKSKTTQSLGAFTLQTNWVQGAAWASEYLAKEQGLFQKEGFSDFVLKYGGADIVPETILNAGGANMAICTTNGFATAVSQGIDLVCVAALYEKNPFCIASLPTNAIREPGDLKGKRIGVPESSMPVWKAFLSLNDIPLDSIPTVPVSYGPTSLMKREVDGILSWVINDPLSLRLQNTQHVVMMLADFKVSLYEGLWVITRQELTEHSDRALAGLKAELIAHQMMIKDPQVGVDLSLNKYAKEADDNPVYARQLNVESGTLADTPTARTRGLCYLQPDQVGRNIETLKLGGYTVSQNAYSSELLDKIYAKGPNLIG